MNEPEAILRCRVCGYPRLHILSGPFLECCPRCARWAFDFAYIPARWERKTVVHSEGG